MGVICGDCFQEFANTAELTRHYRESDAHTGQIVTCAYCKKRFLAKRTLIRHLDSYHADRMNQSVSSGANPSGTGSVEDTASLEEGHSVATSQGDVEDDSVGDDTISIPPEMSVQESVDEAAVDVLVNLRSTASLTGKAVERFEVGCNKMLQNMCSSLKAKLQSRLLEKGMATEDISALLNDFDVADPFRNLKSIDDQLDYFNKKFGLVKPQEMYFDHRTDKRLDPKSNSYVPAQVNETFQYVSVIDTLKAILSDAKVRNLIFKQLVSKDGAIRSFVDGYHFKDHPFLEKHEAVLHILLFYDELETANALGSKTIIHKLGAFFYQILNLPAEILSKMSSIHLLALVNSDDMKKPGAFKKVLTTFVQEMKQLPSDEGVAMNLDDEEIIVRAVVTALTADSLAADDLLGFVGPSARHFCRKCMVSRAQVRADANAMGIPRTKDLHQAHLEEVERRKKFSTECGVKRPCPLDDIPYFSSVENCVFDSFHDILEGIGPLVLKLVLREYIIIQKLFSVKDLNGNIASFSYGIPDSKNKPSPNFTDEMLKKRRTNLKQTGSQMWCLIRSLPFLISVPGEADPHLRLIFLLQDIMQIIFSFEIQPQDITMLEHLVFEHNTLFKNLFIKTQLVEDVAEEEVDDPTQDEIEQEVQNEPSGTEESNVPENSDGEGEQDEERYNMRKEENFTVHVINKLHHIKHYPEMIRQYGNPVRMWCAKFEGRLKIFRQHSSVRCNFKNICKTMAKMFQLSNLKSVRLNFDDGIEHQKPTTLRAEHSLHCSLLEGEGISEEDEIHVVNSATVNGEEYRPALFVVLPTSNCQQPSFGIITEVIVTGGAGRSVILIVKPWRSLGRSQRFNSYRVIPEDNPERAESIAVNVSSLTHFRCIAPWSTKNEEVHLSLRTVLV